MRCLNCRYDLRGQTTPRCPECGRAFDADDPTTYFDPENSACRLAWVDLRAGWRNRWPYIGILWAFFTFCATPSCSFIWDPFPRYQRTYDATNLRAIVQAWSICQNDDTCGAEFDLQAVLPILEPRFNRYASRWKNRLQHARPPALLFWAQLFAFFLLSHIAFRGASHRMAIVFAVCFSLTAFVGIGAFAYIAVLNSTFQESLAYVNDYYYLTFDDDLTPIDHVIAYSSEPVSWNYGPDGPKRYIVAFGDSHVECMLATDLYWTLAAQGETLATPP